MNVKMNGKIIEIFEKRGWGLYKYSQSLSEMIYTGYENIRIEAGIHYVPFPLVNNPRSPEDVYENIKRRVTDFKNSDTLLNRLPFFVDLETEDNNIKVLGIYVIDSVIYEVGQICLVIDPRFKEMSGVYAEIIGDMKNPNIVLNDEELNSLEKKIMSASR